MDEYIGRGTAIAKLTALEVTEPNATMADVRRLLADIPAADVAPVRHGHWIDGFIPDSMLCGCSECGFTCGAHSFLYCPSCGAKMDGETEGNDG